MTGCGEVVDFRQHLPLDYAVYDDAAGIQGGEEAVNGGSDSVPEGGDFRVAIGERLGGGIVRFYGLVASSFLWRAFSSRTLSAASNIKLCRWRLNSSVSGGMRVVYAARPLARR